MSGFDQLCPRCGHDIHGHTLAADPDPRSDRDVYLCADQVEDVDL